MQALDQTIANVALPYMQGSLSATYDEITWVLTSYITAAAIMTAPVGWLAARFGRKYLFITCLIGFTVTSMMCGAAQSLTQMVVVPAVAGRVRRGAGAAVAVDDDGHLSDRAARQGHGDLGRRRDGRADPRPDPRRLPDRDVQLALRVLHQPAVRHPGDAGPDVLHARGRSATSICGSTGSASPCCRLGIGGLQMMLDRGQDQDWFTSREIIIEAVLGGLGVYLFVVHMMTAKKPFIPPVLFKDRNFTAGAVADVRHRHDPGVEFLADGALAAEPGELPGGGRGADHGTARHRHDGGDADRRAAGQPGSIRAS